MPISPNFASSQSVGQPSIIILTDISTGSDVSVVARRVYITNASGATVLPAGNTLGYVNWPVVALTGDTIQIDALTEDMALNIIVNWVTAGGVTVVTKTILCGFTLYNESYYYTLTQQQAADPEIKQDSNYYENKMKLRVEIDSGNQAIQLANDISGAQNCYNRASYLVANADLFF